MITRKKLTAVASAFALAGTLAVATPAGAAEDQSSTDSITAGSSNEGNGTDNASSTDGLSSEDNTNDGSSFNGLSSEAEADSDGSSVDTFSSENSTAGEGSSTIQKVGLAALILGVIAAAVSALPQLQQYLPKF